MIILTPSKQKIQVYIGKKTHIKYTGYFTLTKSYKHFIEDISLQKKYKEVNIKPNELIELFRTNKVIITKKTPELTEFLKEEEIKYTQKHVCENCLQNDIIKTLTPQHEYTLINKVYCRICASKYLNHMNSINGYTGYSKYRYELLLNKYHDLMKVLDIMEEKYDPTNSTLTLYDTLPATEEKYPEISINQLNIPIELKNVLNKRIKYLLPVQCIALQNGLLDDENLLVVSATASGKTLIGELPGITKALDNKKMIYLSPLVALANQKYRDFKREYEQLGLKVAIKVGHNRVKTEEELYIPDEPIEDADIIVATYEGLDYILRSGNYQDLNDLGVVVIDEIHMLDNEERGYRLNGLVNRLQTLYPDSQLIALSATIRNANEIAKAFNMKLVRYDKRPVKLERHMVPVKSYEKMNIIAGLCENEYNNVSSKNYHGQSIIFTDSRRNTERINNYLNKYGIKSAYYHAGLTYNRKLEIEEEYAKQNISTIVTTSALANGVDFPASLVIFESLRMGYDWLTPNDFHQMLGRAGRPSYHDIGKVYLLPEIDHYSDIDYMVACTLLKTNVQNVNVLFNDEDVYEQVLADVCAMGIADLDVLEKHYNKLFLPVGFDEALLLLNDKKMINVDTRDNVARPTSYGISVSKSFIKVSTAEYIKNNLFTDILDICLNIKTINNVYLSGMIINSFKKSDYNISNRLFNTDNRIVFYDGHVLDILDTNCQNKIVNIVNDFMLCDCHDSPVCDCLEKNISSHIINRRLQGWSPVMISKEFKRVYALDVYPGDIYSYLDQVIQILESIKRIARVYNVSGTVEDCIRTIEIIEEG